MSSADQCRGGGSRVRPRQGVDGRRLVARAAGGHLRLEPRDGRLVAGRGQIRVDAGRRALIGEQLLHLTVRVGVARVGEGGQCAELHPELAALRQLPQHRHRDWLEQERVLVPAGGEPGLVGVERLNGLAVHRQRRNRQAEPVVAGGVGLQDLPRQCQRLRRLLVAEGRPPAPERLRRVPGRRPQ